MDPLKHKIPQLNFIQNKVFAQQKSKLLFPNPSPPTFLKVPSSIPKFKAGKNAVVTSEVLILYLLQHDVALFLKVLYFWLHLETSSCVVKVKLRSWKLTS